MSRATYALAHGPGASVDVLRIDEDAVAERVVILQTPFAGTKGNLERTLGLARALCRHMAAEDRRKTREEQGKE